MIYCLTWFQILYTVDILLIDIFFDLLLIDILFDLVSMTHDRGRGGGGVLLRILCVASYVVSNFCYPPNYFSYNTAFGVFLPPRA